MDPSTTLVSRPLKKHIQRAYQDSLWRHFSINVDQRLKMFQFFITISTALLGGAFLLPKAGGGIPVHWGIGIIGFLACCFSALFWMLDRRTRQLLTSAKDAIRKFDVQTIPGDENEPLRLFDKENQSSKVTSQTACFRFAFGLVAALGVSGMLMAIFWMNGSVGPSLSS